MLRQVSATVHPRTAGLAAAVLALALGAGARTAAAAPGDLDTSFGVGGLVVVPSIGVFERVAVQPGGKIVAAGSSGCSPVFCGSSVPFLVRFDSSGNLDGSFGAGGIISVANFDVR